VYYQSNIGTKTMIEEIKDIREYFRENDNTFTIYVVEQRFVVGRGHDYLCSFKGKPNYIDSDLELESLLQKIVGRIYKAVPNLAGIVESIFLKKDSSMPLKEIVSLLVNLFTPNDHQAAGPEVLDPIIIQEGKVSNRKLSQFIALHRESILRPAIIIMLKDNNFDRARGEINTFPHGINVKFIHNDGETEIIRVINPGADSVESFINAYTTHCFSTCAQTNKSIVLGSNFGAKSSVEEYGLELMRIRSKLLFSDKTLVKEDLDYLITQISCISDSPSWDATYLKTFETVLRLFRLFCNDGGVEDIQIAKKLADELDNAILKAHVMRNSYFIPNITRNEMNEQMENAYKIFSENGIEDYAIYSRNNRLVRQFDTPSLDLNEFIDLQAEALNAVPGMVGMSHIINNTGAALLTYGNPEKSMTYFKKALDYAHRPERAIQEVAIRSNMAIALCRCYKNVDEAECKTILDKITSDPSVYNLPFLSARYALNILSVAFSQNAELGRFLLKQYKVDQLIDKSLKMHPLGSGQMILQIQTMVTLYGKIPELEPFLKLRPALEAKGIRKEYIEKTGFNPCSFSTWF